MTNEVYRPYGYPWACLYDRRAHAEETLGQVREVHPRLLESGGESIPSTEYVTPRDFVVRSARYLPVPQVVELDVELTGPGELARLRRLLGRWVGGHGVEGDDAHDVLIAVSETATNALQQGAPPVRVQAFTDGGVAGSASTTPARLRCSRPPATTTPAPPAVAASDFGSPVNSPTSSPPTPTRRGRPTS